MRPRLRKVGLRNNIVHDNIVRDNIVRNNKVHNNKMLDNIVRDQKESVSVAGQRITVDDKCAQLAGGSLSLKVYPLEAPCQAVPFRGLWHSFQSERSAHPSVASCWLRSSWLVRLFEEGIGELENDEIMNFGILDGVEHMEHIAVI